MSWPLVRLGDLATFLNGGTPTKANPAFFEGTIPWITGADIVSQVARSSRSFITKEAISRSATNLVPEGTVLLVTRTSVGKVAVAGMDLCFSQDITAICHNQTRLHTGYLVHFLKTKQSHFEKAARGATIKGITRDVVASIVIPLPPLDEQKRIAAILDQAEELRAKRRAAIALLDQLPQAIFLEMFGDLDQNPKGFKKVKLSEFCDLQNGFAFRSTDYLDFSNTLNCRMSNIRPNGLFDPAYSPKYLPDSFATKYRNFLLKDGDVIIAMTDMANEARILGVPTVVQTEGLTFLLNQRVGKLLYDASTVSLEFLKQALMDSSIKKYYMKFASGGVQINLGKADLLSASIYLPPFEAQLQYASRVESIYRAKAAHQTALAELEALFASLQTRAFPTGIGSPKELSNVRV